MTLKKQHSRSDLYDAEGELIMSSSAFEEIPLFFADVQEYRSTLSMKDRRVFDDVWGFSFSATDTYFQSVKNSCERIFRKLLKKDAKSVDLVLISELKRVHEVVLSEMQYFGRRDVSNIDKNKKLINLFVKDLLSSANGKILENKFRRDNSPREKVSIQVKVCTWVFIVLLLLALLFYIYLFAMQQTASRQKAWFQTFMMWIMFEILLVSSAIVFFQHVVIPSFILNDLKKVRSRVIEDVNAYKAKIERRVEAKKEAIQATGVENFELSEAEIEEEMEQLTKETNEGCVFNAAKYLYVSHRLAKALPQLPISINVLQFSTPWPNQSLKEENKMSDNYNAKFTFVGQSASKVLYFVLLGLVSVPEPVQDALIEVVSTSGLGYVIVLCIQIYAFSPFLVFVPFTLIACSVGLIIHTSKQSSFLSKVDVEPKLSRLTTSSEMEIVVEESDDKPIVLGVSDDERNDSDGDIGEDDDHHCVIEKRDDQGDAACVDTLDVDDYVYDKGKEGEEREVDDEESEDDEGSDDEDDGRSYLSTTPFYFFEADVPKSSTLLQKSSSEVRQVVLTVSKNET
jgi:hypothetical protein